MAAGSGQAAAAAAAAAEGDCLASYRAISSKLKK
jgi:hypothetical protein